MRLGPLKFLDELARQWERVNVANVAAALTYFAVLSLFPFLLFMVVLGSFMVDPVEIRALVLQFARFAPPEVAQLLADRVQSVVLRRSVGLLAFGAAVSFVSAAGGIMALMGALNAVCGVKDRRPFWKQWLIALASTLGAAVLGLLAALIALLAPLLTRLLGRFEETGELVVGWLRLPVSALLMILLWGTLYYVLPDAKPRRFRIFTAGSVVGVLVWVAASWGFSLYVQQFGRFEVTYGALGGIIVLLLWLYLSSLALLVGAQVNDVIGRAREEERQRRKSPPRLPKPHPAVETALGAAALAALLSLGRRRPGRAV
ncbi:MAG: YihY/virulence factor BrkB family protein [Myxococcaceae bacterium]